MRVAAAVDIGATRTKLGIVADDGRVVRSGAITTTAKGDPLPLVDGIAASLREAYPRLDVRRFVADGTRGLGGLELVARGAHVADVMRRHLPEDFATAADVVVRSLGPELERTEGFGMAPFRYLPHVVYVAPDGPRGGCDARAHGLQSGWNCRHRA